MHYYRYRSDSEVSFKELIYNEIYFGSPEECNDPYDSRVFYEFPQDKVRWRRLLDQAIPIEDELFKSLLLDDLSEYICSKPPMTLEELISNHFLNTSPLNTRMQVQTLKNMENAIRNLIAKYIPATRYFACFSTVSSDMQMWSHYANHHRGFCLIFKSIDNKLKLDRSQFKRQINRKTPFGFAQSMSYTMEDEFEFQSIDYRQSVEPINAFNCLSQYIFGEEVNDEEKELVRQKQHCHFWQKELSWSAEKESRLILSPPPSWLFGEHINYTKHERLFHYQPTQLVGVIIGAKMSQENRTRLSEIILEKNEKLYLTVTKPYIKFDFATFEAILSSNQRTIEIHPKEIFGATSLKPGDKDFDVSLKRWHEGWGLNFGDNYGSRKIQIF